jgi:quercetin dioxygenase-like cupin family protein
MAEKKTKILEDCIANSKNLNELIEYSGDSVVSKTLIDKTTGTITLFAFDKNQSLSEHTTPYDAVVQVLDGQGVFVIGGKSVTAKSGQIMIMPADVPHSVNAVERFKMMLIMIRDR